MSIVRQIGRFGSPAQRQRAADILARTKADLYQVMADAPTEPDPDDPES